MVCYCQLGDYIYIYIYVCYINIITYHLLGEPETTTEVAEVAAMRRTCFHWWWWTVTLKAVAAGRISIVGGGFKPISSIGQMGHHLPQFLGWEQKWGDQVVVVSQNYGLPKCTKNAAVSKGFGLPIWGRHSRHTKSHLFQEMHLQNKFHFQQAIRLYVITMIVGSVVHPEKQSRWNSNMEVWTMIFQTSIGWFCRVPFSSMFQTSPACLFVLHFCDGHSFGGV